MAIKTSSPQISALLAAVEKEFGHPVRTPADFLLVADRVEEKIREHISDSTIKRLWKPALGYATVAARTVDVLAKYVGFDHYEQFVEHLAKQSGAESEMAEGENCIKAENLSVGDIVRISWLPDRECRFKYLGERKFEAIECHNSKISCGDTFYCSNFIQGRKLFVDNLTHDGTLYASYGMGTEHGITSVALERDHEKNPVFEDS